MKGKLTPKAANAYDAAAVARLVTVPSRHEY